MENLKEVRWKQRFQNFEKSYLLLSKTLEIGDPSEVEQAGIIQFFETTFELSWKLLKDFLEQEGFVVKSPRQTLKQAFQSDILENGQLWLDALEDRNKTSHLYDEEAIKEIVLNIRTKYIQETEKLYLLFKLKNNE